MLLVLLVWLGIAVASWVVGAAVERLLRPFFPDAPAWTHPAYLILTGLMVLGALLNTLCLLGWGVLAYRFFVWGAIALLALGFWRSLAQNWQGLQQQFRQYRWWMPLVYLGFFLAYLITAAAPSQMGDAANYHLPAINVLERYGVIVGIGNFHHHIPLWTQWYPLQAFFAWASASTPASDGYYELTAFVFPLFLWISLDHLALWYRQPRQLLHAVPVFTPLVFILHLITDAANDVPAWIAVFAAASLLIRHQYAQKLHWAPLVVLVIGVGTWKITHAAFSLYLAWLLYRLWAAGSWQGIAASLGLCLVLLGPFFALSLVGTGYLLYPVVPVGFLGLPWAVPEWWAWHSNNPTHYGLPANISKSSWQWISFWFTEYYPPKEVLFTGTGFLLAFLVPLLWVWRGCPWKADLKALWAVLVLGTLVVFFVGSPEFRYGAGFFTLLTLLGGAIVLSELNLPWKSTWVIGLAILLGAWGFFRIYEAQKHTCLSATLWEPVRIATEYQLKKGQAYNRYFPHRWRMTPACPAQEIPKKDCWTTPFPCPLRKRPLPPLRGQTLEEGFLSRPRPHD